MQRQAEIEAKKAKLAELRRQRELRQQEFSATRQNIGVAQEQLKSSSPSARKESKEDLDNLIARLVGDNRKPTPPSPRTPTSSGKALSSRAASPPLHSDQALSTGVVVASSGTQTLAVSAAQTSYDIKSDAEKKEVLTYSKGVQTIVKPSSRSSSRASSVDLEDAYIVERKPRRSLGRRERAKEESLRQNIRREVEEELNASRQIAEEAILQKNQHATLQSLSLEQRELVLSSHDFLDFVERSSKVAERALDEDYDVLADYGGINRSGFEDDDDDDLGVTGGRGRRVREVMQFYDERWSKRRIISDIAFSPKFPELLLSAHTKNPSSPYDPPGIIQVWNSHMQARPEYIFHANSDVLTARFSPFNPNYILGGTYSGQVLLWDTRSSSAQPVQKTPLTGTGLGHTHPIYSINIVGTQNAHNIISTSTDGIVCSWSIDMLSSPQEYLELTAPAPSAPIGPIASTGSITGLNPYNLPTTLSPLATAFPPADPSYFLAGTEAGPVHLVHRYDRAGSKAGVDAFTTFTGHAAPVMSLDFHKASGPLDLGDLMLSTGLDWSVRLWRVRTPGSLGAEAFTGAEQDRRSRDVKPLLTMQRDEPVYDARWNPARPGIFASATGAGQLEIWDLNSELQAPVARVVPIQRDDGTGTRLLVPGAESGRSLNKCAWEPSEGKRIATGGLDGVVTVFEVGGELGGRAGARQEEWTGVKKLVTRLDSEGRS